jgi:hypothetical protein
VAGLFDTFKWLLPALFAVAAGFGVLLLGIAIDWVVDLIKQRNKPSLS